MERVNVKQVTAIGAGCLVFALASLFALFAPRWLFLAAERRVNIDQVCNAQLIGLSSAQAQNRISSYRLPRLIVNTETGLMVGLGDARCEITLGQTRKVIGIRINREQWELE